MKTTLMALGAIIGSAVAKDAIPTQTFFVPMPEKDVFDVTFKSINSNARGPVNSIVALSISTDNTIVWYDHHEDGYESSDPNNYRDSSAFSPSTEVWGDGDCSNGYAAGTVCNSPADDVLKAGQSIVIENEVDVSNDANNPILYDGGDKVLASFPIAITRGEYPESPSSLMAGAVEVLDISQWGTSFVAPVGSDVRTGTAAFQHTSFYVMAKDDNTVIEFSDGEKATLGAGDSLAHLIAKKGTTLTATKPVQVDLVTGDRGSTYELRWFSLLPTNEWTNNYFSPVGDSTGDLKIYLYNPNSSSLQVSVKHSDEKSEGWGWRSGARLYPEEYTVSVPAKGYAFTNVVPSGTGALLTASNNFIALSLTDTSGSGQIYDWGFPVLPTEKLTSQVLVGWGYGCTEKNCGRGNNVGGVARSVVWVSPVEEADIYVDINNDGTPEDSKTIYSASRLSSNIIENGEDLSGAVIWAVKPGQPFDSSESVLISAAWGQNSIYSMSNDYSALDLGTLVPPFVGVRVDAALDDLGTGMVRTLQVQNAGQSDYNICNDLDTLELDVEAGEECVFIRNGVEESCEISGDSCIIPKRGGISYFEIRSSNPTAYPTGAPTASPSAKPTPAPVAPTPAPVAPTPAPVSPTPAPVPLGTPKINIEKTVHLGSLPTCFNGQELEYGFDGTLVTYCYEIINIGDVPLTVRVTDGPVGTDETLPEILAPGASVFVHKESSITADLTSLGVVVGTPADGQNDVTDEDPAGVALVPEKPVCVPKT